MNTLFVCHVREVENGFVIEVDGACVMQSSLSHAGNFYHYKSNDYVATDAEDLGNKIEDLASRFICNRIDKNLSDIADNATSSIEFMEPEKASKFYNVGKAKRD